MAEGRLRMHRRIILDQAALFCMAMSRDQVADYIALGELNGSVVNGEPPPMPYDPDALRALVESGRMR